jgi:hypothetical protein
MTVPYDDLGDRIAGKILVELCPAIYAAACRIAEITETGEQRKLSEEKEITLHTEWAISIKDGLEFRPAASEAWARHLRDKLIDSGFYKPEQLTVVRRLATEWGKPVHTGIDAGPAEPA